VVAAFAGSSSLRWMLRDFALDRLQFLHRQRSRPARLRRSEVLKWIPRIRREICTMLRARPQRSRDACLGFIPARNGLQLLAELLAFL
jgi:hypothetical protein